MTSEFMGAVEKWSIKVPEKFSSAGSILIKQCHNYKSKCIAVNLCSAKSNRRMFLDNLYFLNNNVMKLNLLISLSMFN